MKRLYFIFILIFSFSIFSCDDSSSSSGNNEQNNQNNVNNNNQNNNTQDFTVTIQALNASYDSENQVLKSEVTVTVSDLEGSPVSGQFVTLSVNNEEVTVDASNVETDENGEAVFNLYSNSFVSTTVSVYVSSTSPVELISDNLMETTAIVNFSLTVEITPVGEPTYEYTGATFPLNVFINIQDSTSVGLANASVMVSDTTDASVSPDANSYVTDSDGSFTMNITTTLDGTHIFEFTLAGINGVLSASYAFLGLELAGTITTDFMSYPYFNNPKIAAFSMFPEGDGLLEQASDAQDLDTSIDTVNYSLHLPIVPSNDILMYDPSENNYISLFPVAVFNDDNNNGTWDEEEPIIGTELSSPIALFAKPESDATGMYGWFMFDFENSTPVNWEPSASQRDFSITRAPVYEPEINGDVNVISMDPNAVLRIAYYIADATALEDSANPQDVFLDPTSSLLLGDVEVSTTHNYSINLTEIPDASILDNWKIINNENADLDPYVMVPVFAFVYQDANTNGQFDSGDLILGKVKLPVGYKSNMIYSLSYDPIISFYRGERLWLHRGYNRTIAPIVYTIAGINSSIITLNEEVEHGHTGLDFEIYENEDDIGDSTPIASGTVSTNSSSDSQILTIDACIGCDTATSGNVFIFTYLYDELTFLDWSEPVDIDSL